MTVVSPLGQVDRWKDSTLAWHSWIAVFVFGRKCRLISVNKAGESTPDLHFMIGQHHRVDLHRIDQIGVVADEPRQLGLADLLELFGREGRRLVRQFVPEPIATADVAELGGNDTGEGGSQHRSRQRAFGHTARPQIHVRWMSGRREIEVRIRFT